jgi:hypothetical protein
MRSSRNPSGSVARSVGNHAGAGKSSAGELAAPVVAAGELAMDEPESKTLVAKPMVENLSMPHGPSNVPPASIPMEWLDSANWRLPSGKALAEFALQAGFLAPLLFGAEGFGKAAMKSANGLPAVGVGAGRAKNCSKGAGR